MITVVAEPFTKLCLVDFTLICYKMLPNFVFEGERTFGFLETRSPFVFVFTFKKEVSLEVLWLISWAQTLYHLLLASIEKWLLLRRVKPSLAVTAIRMQIVVKS